MRADLDRFYELLGELETLPGQGRTLAECTGSSGWPERGVYFFREPGEHRAGQSHRPRIVRVGTHAVSGGAKSTLWKRLYAHRGRTAGGGNHRGSIFRLHVGAALLRRERATIGDLPSWGDKSSAAKASRAAEVVHERRVSEHLGRMSVLWLEVPDEPGPTSLRAFVERNAIALLSNGLEPVDPPSDGWLGRASPREEIQSSGLWNLNHVSGRVHAGFLDTMAGLVEAMRANRRAKPHDSHSAKSVR